MMAKVNNTISVRGRVEKVKILSIQTFFLGQEFKCNLDTKALISLDISSNDLVWIRTLALLWGRCKNPPEISISTYWSLTVNICVAGPIPQKTYRSRLVSSFIENTVNCKIHTKAIVTIFIVINLHSYNIVNNKFIIPYASYNSQTAIS